MTDLAKRTSGILVPSRFLVRGAMLSTILGLGFSAAASDRSVDHAGTSTATQNDTTHTKHWFQVGKASWYGFPFQGRKTANGEKYDMNSLTCAHRSLPLGSWIRVTNLHNRKSVFVRVNDRGPMIDDRIVDLSYAAAHKVGLAGVGKVKLEPVRQNDPEMTRALLAQVNMPASIVPASR